MAWRTFAEITSSQATVITEDSGDQVYCIPFSWLDDNFTYLKDRIYTGSGSPVDSVSPEQDKAWYFDTSDNSVWFWDGSSWTKINANDADTVDGKHASDFLPVSTDSAISASISGNQWLSVATSGIVSLPKQSACVAYLSANQSITADTWAKVALDTVEIDIQNEFDSTNHRVTVSEAGKYICTGIVCFAPPGAAGDFLLTSLWINGSEKATAYTQAVESQKHTLVISKIFELSAGDYIELYVKDINSDATLLGTNYATFLHVAKIA